MVMDRRVHDFAKIRSALSVPVAPIQYAATFPARLIASVNNAMHSQKDLLTEVDLLKAAQLELLSRLQRLDAIEAENNYLKSLLQASQKVKGRKLIAELLAIDTEPFVHQVTVDKGSKDGVYAGQPVLDANGVMGQVASVGPLTSRVLLISDARSGVAVQNVRSGIRAVISGDNYSDKLRLLYVPKTADVRVGDLFLTSGLGNRYPEGYPVGKVVSVYNDPTKQFMDIAVAPSASIDTSRQVLLIWYKDHA